MVRALIEAGATVDTQDKVSQIVNYSELPLFRASELRSPR